MIQFLIGYILHYSFNLILKFRIIMVHISFDKKENIRISFFEIFSFALFPVVQKTRLSRFLPSLMTPIPIYFFLQQIKASDYLQLNPLFYSPILFSSEWIMPRSSAIFSNGLLMNSGNNFQLFFMIFVTVQKPCNSFLFLKISCFFLNHLLISYFNWTACIRFKMHLVKIAFVGRFIFTNN